MVSHCNPYSRQEPSLGYPTHMFCLHDMFMYETIGIFLGPELHVHSKLLGQRQWPQRRQQRGDCA
jgi:hypothetical protein